jgi:predicted nuclease of predicted toxin-antitoxin system
MKLLLDECVPRRLKRDFPQHEISTVIEAGFQGLKNGRLLESAANLGFEVLITVDQNIIYQQNLKTLPLAILVLIAPHNKYELLVPLLPQVLNALQGIRIGQIVYS